MPKWVVIGESVNESNGNLDLYPREKGDLNNVMIALSPIIEPFAISLSCMLTAAVLRKLG